jgi:NAD(P)-dependent dehydrogenase (short-subunit alcohol dehydrogenase family)
MLEQVYYGNDGSHHRIQCQVLEALAGRGALVTGGSRGLGAAIAKELADAGATTIINYHHTADIATHVLEEIDAAGGKASTEAV